MGTKRAHTLRDVADRVGVGPATASVVLNGARGGTKVSERTREAIIQAARDLDYRPNAVARSLRTRRTGIVGYLSGYEFIDPRNPYMADVMAGLQSACAERELDLLLYTPHARHTPEEVVSNLVNGRLDGLILTAREDHPIVAPLIRSHLPVVAIADALPGVPSVVADAGEGGRLQARHLAELGHRRVLYVPADYPFLSVLDREASFRAEAARLGLRVETAAPIPGFCDPASSCSPFPAQEIARLGPGRCTAVVAWDDGPAHRICGDLVTAGLRVPEDVSVVGYNGSPSSHPPRWNLTTIRADWSRVALTAVATLADLIEGRDVQATTVLPIDIIPGATASSVPPTLPQS